MVIACLVIASVLDPDIEECMVERENCTFTLTGKIERGLKHIHSFYSPFIFTLTLLTVTGTIESGLPTLQLPQFGTGGSFGGNGTEMAAGEQEHTSLGTMISRF